MQLQTILNRVQRHRSFVYGAARFQNGGQGLALKVTLAARQTGIVGRVMLFLGRKPEDTECYKQLKQVFDQIKTDCKKAPGVPVALAGPCGGG
jgi:hypothetical protein